MPPHAHRPRSATRVPGGRGAAQTASRPRPHAHRLRLVGTAAATTFFPLPAPRTQSVGFFEVPRNDCRPPKAHGLRPWDRLFEATPFSASLPTGRDPLRGCPVGVGPINDAQPRPRREQKTRAKSHVLSTPPIRGTVRYLRKRADERGKGSRNRSWHHQLGHGMPGRVGPQRHDPQRRGRADHAQHRPVRPQRSGGGQERPQRRDHPSRPGGPMGQARHGGPLLQPPHPRRVPAAGGHSGLHLAEAEARPGGRRRPGGQDGHHRPRLLRRAAAQGDRRRRPDGGAPDRRHRQRADRRRPGLRRSASATCRPAGCPASKSPSWSTTSAAAPSTSPC